jgi:hypothetical protein
MSPEARAGHHADVVYVHEDGNGGFNSSPSDSTHKIFGGNTTADIDGSRDPVKIWNSARTSAEHVSRVFDGGVTIDGELGAYGPWWLSEVYGSASEAGSTAPSVYHYQLDVGGDPRSMRVLAPIDGMASVNVAKGVVPQTLTISENFPDNPTFTLDCVYAQEELTTSTISVPSFTYGTYNNAEAQMQIGGTTIGRLQNWTLTANLNADLVGEIGSSVMVDFSPKAFEPTVDAQRIVTTSASTAPENLLQHFYGGGTGYTHAPSTATVSITLDNGSTGASMHRQNYSVIGAIPSDLSRTNINDPDADLLREVSEMADNLDVKVEIGQAAK